MNSNRKIIIQALAFIIFSILLYREWYNPDARFLYIEFLCFSEVLIEFGYLFFNRKSINKDDRSKEIVQILLYLIIMVAVLLISELKH